MRPPKVFVSYLRRSNVAVNLWSSERREKRNNWKDVLRIPYPRGTLSRTEQALMKSIEMSRLLVTHTGRVGRDVVTVLALLAVLIV